MFMCRSSRPADSEQRINKRCDTGGLRKNQQQCQEHQHNHQRNQQKQLAAPHKGDQFSRGRKVRYEPLYGFHRISGLVFRSSFAAMQLKTVSLRYRYRSGRSRPWESSWMPWDAGGKPADRRKRAPKSRRARPRKNRKGQAEVDFGILLLHARRLSSRPTIASARVTLPLQFLQCAMDLPESPCFCIRFRRNATANPPRNQTPTAVHRPRNVRRE